MISEFVFILLDVKSILPPNVLLFIIALVLKLLTASMLLNPKLLLLITVALLLVLVNMARGLKKKPPYPVLVFWLFRISWTHPALEFWIFLTI